MKVLKNPRHERFARLICQGLTHVDAYRKCYPDQSPASITCNSAKLWAELDVKNRVAEINDMVASEYAMSLGEKRDTLRRMALGEIPTKVIRKYDGKVEAVFDRIAALQMDAKLGGEFAPEQVNVTNTGPTLKLDFSQVLSRKTQLPPALEAEWERIKTHPEPVLLEDAAGAADLTSLHQYADKEVKFKNAQSLDKVRVDIENLT
jgi:hypothetical protein